MFRQVERGATQRSTTQQKYGTDRNSPQMKYILVVLIMIVRKMSTAENRSHP